MERGCGGDGGRRGRKIGSPHTARIEGWKEAERESLAPGDDRGCGCTWRAGEAGGIGG